MISISYIFNFKLKSSIKYIDLNSKYSNLKRNEDGKMSLFDTESGSERFKASFVAINYWLKRNKENKGWNYQRFSVLWEKACRKAKKKTPLI